MSTRDRVPDPDPHPAPADASTGERAMADLHERRQLVTAEVLQRVARATGLSVAELQRRWAPAA